MSLYKDKNLIETLLRIAQTAQPGTPAPADLQNLAQKLVSNLQSQLNQTDKFTATRENADLRTVNLKNLDSLLGFLNLNGIKFNNLKIALRNEGAQAALSGRKSEGNLELDLLDNSQKQLYMTYPYENPQYFVYKDGLIAYLRDLQSKGNSLLKTMADKLIEQANTGLGTNISKDAPKEEKKLDPTTVVDDFSTPLTSENPNARGPIQLTVSDLESFKSKDAFFSRILAKIPYSKGGKVVSVDEMDKGSLCDFIGIVHDRAARYYEMRGEERFKAYLDAATEAASMYSCPVNRTQSTPGAQTVSYVSSNGALTDAGATALSSVQLPLDPEEVDFTRIKNFANKYVQITKDQTRVTSVLNAVSKIEQEYPSIKNQNLARYSVADVAKDIYQTTGRTSPFEYIETVRQALYGTQQMLSNLSAMLRSSAGSKPIDELRASIGEQLNYFSKNNNYLDRWTQDMKAQFSNLQQQARK